MKKIYFTQTEIAELLNEEVHTIRYWEKSFPALRPKTGKSGHRVYNIRNVKLFMYVQKLIREDKLSNIGTKQKLEEFLAKSKSKIDFVQASEDNENNNVGVHQEDLITFTKEEFIELLQIMQLMLNMIKVK